MTVLRCIGVPEHFNLPWHLAIEDGAFSRFGVKLLWNDEPKGTGAMCAALRDGSTDLAVMVSAGTVKGCLANPDIKIVGTFVDTPLTWGVHVPKGSSIQSVQGIDKPKFAISRFNSGSHLLAYLYASGFEWNLNKDSFEVVHDLNGARARFADNPALLFLWEKFTTDFLVKLNEFRRIDEVRPPWPCFMIAARKQVIKEHPSALRRTLECVRISAKKLMTRSDGAQLVAARYDLPLPLAKEWWKTVSWNTNGTVSALALGRISSTLAELGILKEATPGETLFDQITVQL